MIDGLRLLRDRRQTPAQALVWLAQKVDHDTMSIRRTRAWALPGGVALLALGGCGEPDIEIGFQRDGDGIVATFEQDRGVIFSDFQTPCITLLTLHEDGQGRQSIVWRIAADRVSCVPLESVLIGETPPGFVEADPLMTELDGAYRLSAIGEGAGIGRFTN